MTNGRGAGMASFMTRKKKYKFQVEICLEELLEVPLITAVLFAKLRLLDGGNFQDTSSREEVRDHKVKWGAKFTFPCKMMANATTGVMERCILRISIRKESRGGRSFTKLGFVDLNLAEYAGAGFTHKKALLEGYDTRHRQDNSMLQFSIALNMLQGDILFKAPSPSLKHKQLIAEDTASEPRTEEFSGGSLGGSIASGSSGFGSLPKKRPQLLTSELVIGQTLTENNLPITIATDCLDIVTQVPADHEESSAEPGHSRNSSNTSQLSKASGYSSIHSHSHSRQSSSGDSGHIRLRRKEIDTSTPTNNPGLLFKIPASPIPNSQNSLPETRTASLNSLQSGNNGVEHQLLALKSVPRGLTHRKLLEGSSGGKLAPLATSPDETPSITTVSSTENSQIPAIRRPSVTTNPSSSSLVLSETGSLDRVKTAYERRKKAQASEDTGTVSGRVEITRVNPDDLIEELIKNTNLEPTDDSAETSGLQLFIAKDGTAALGNHEVKSQMSTGVQVFKQVVMDDR